MNTKSSFPSGPDYWAHVDLARVPNMETAAPGPASKAMHARCTKYFKGLSGQVKLFPVAFESGHGCILRDVDGNDYIDFSSGIYVTTLGHCHPKVTEAEHPIMGDVRAKGCLMGIELVKDKGTKAPFDEAGKRVYQKAFAKGLAWIPAGHILRMSPPVVMEEDVLLKGLDMIDEAIGETEKELGY